MHREFLPTRGIPGPAYTPGREITLQAEVTNNDLEPLPTIPQEQRTAVRNLSLLAPSRRQTALKDYSDVSLPTCIVSGCFRLIILYIQNRKFFATLEAALKRITRRLLPCLGASRIFTLCFALLANSANAVELLSPHECEIIDNYQKSEDMTFADRFSMMVHQREFCFSEGEVCRAKLHKRTEDYFLVVAGEKRFPSTEIAFVAEDALLKTLEKIRSVTGVRAIFEKPKNADNFIFLVFVDKDFASRRFQEHLDAWIAPPSVAANSEEKHQLETFFKEFLKTDQSCVAINHLKSHGRIERAQVWIRTDIDEVTMRRCISEEFYNTFGISEGVEVGSIFDYEFSHSQGDVELSDFDLLLLKILYRDEFGVGTLIEETKSSVEELIDSSCPKNS